MTSDDDEDDDDDGEWPTDEGRRETAREGERRVGGRQAGRQAGRYLSFWWFPGVWGIARSPSPRVCVLCNKFNDGMLVTRADRRGKEVV